MRETLIASVVEHRHKLASVGWWLLALILSSNWEPSSVVPSAYSQAINSGCKHLHGHFCVQSGCYYRADIRERGEPRSRLTSEAIPQFVVISHQTGYFRWESVRLTKLEDVQCAVTLLTGNSIVMDILVSLVPAMVLSFLIIVALLLLPASSEPYVLGQAVAKEEIEMEQRYTIESDANSSIDDELDGDNVEE